MGLPLQITDCGNWLAAILLIAGISFQLQLEQISSGMSISPISHWRETYCCYKS
jgi:hypothetical protein